jgi:two-component system, NarL family, response regulator LiaR
MVQMNHETIRVVVVDDHSMVRSGLRLFLLAFDEMVLVGEAANGQEAIRICEQVRPDIVLMDLIMPVMDGTRATRELVSRFPNLRVIGLTSFLEPDLLQEALQAGMSGVLAKDISASELAKAIHDVRSGRPAFSAEVNKLLQVYDPPDSALNPPVHVLTTREREVLSLMASGYSNADIAQRLVISLSTAKFHVSSILDKFNVSSRAEAISVALKYRLTETYVPPIDSDK